MNEDRPMPTMIHNPGNRQPLTVREFLDLHGTGLMTDNTARWVLARVLAERGYPVETAALGPLPNPSTAAVP